MKIRSIGLVAIGALTLLVLIQTSSELRAGKIMRAAKWAAGEAVKAALVEYAKHEANVSFDAFKQNFCSDKEYRTRVLSSSAIKPLVQDQDSAEDLVMETLGCEYEIGKINIVFTDATPGAYTNGHATTCVLKANIHNNSKFHLNTLSFKIDPWLFHVGDMPANSYVDDNDIFSVEGIDSGHSCSAEAHYLMINVQTAHVFECTMPNVAEGDCQDMVSISTTLDSEAIERINAVDRAHEIAAAAEDARQAARKRAERWAELGQYNLRVGNVLIEPQRFALSYAFKTYDKIPNGGSDLIGSNDSGPVCYLGVGYSREITVVFIHKDADGLDDYYFVKSLWFDANNHARNCTRWIATDQVISFRKQGQLCVRGVGNCA